KKKPHWQTTQYSHSLANTQNCKLSSESERKVLNRLETLAHKNFTVESKNEKESYIYVFQLCGDAGGIPGAGVIQVDSKKTENKPRVIGTYNLTQVIGGSDWVELTYRNDDAYGQCSKEMSKAVIMFTCKQKTDVVSEKDKECFYLFEMASSAVCPDVQSQLSTGSIILIIGFCLLTFYLIGGFLYQRLVVGAKGMEQFPNYAFWVEVGNLTADGCDFVCRSRSREEASAYRGVSAEPLEEEPEERDDQLLPM
uniref:MRH domain-containing protein n=1 Tax=Mola mola TaxID=94237 RepID=A0A3Q4AL86_MOLML